MIISRGFPNLSLTHSSVMVAPKDTNFAVIEPSGADMVVTSKGCNFVLALFAYFIVNDVPMDLQLRSAAEGPEKAVLSAVSLSCWSVEEVRPMKRTDIIQRRTRHLYLNRRRRSGVCSCQSSGYSSPAFAFTTKFQFTEHRCLHRST